MPYNPCCCGDSPCVCCAVTPVQWELVVDFGQQDVFGSGYHHCLDISGMFYLDPVESLPGVGGNLCLGENCCWWSPEFTATTRTDTSPPFDTATHRWIINAQYNGPSNPCGLQLTLLRLSGGNWLAQDGAVPIVGNWLCTDDVVTFGIANQQFTTWCWMGNVTWGGTRPIATPLY